VESQDTVVTLEERPYLSSGPPRFILKGGMDAHVLVEFGFQSLRHWQAKLDPAMA